MTDLCVTGLGYVGLPTAALFAKSGLRVVGVDINPRIIAAVNAGSCPIEEPGLSALLREVVSRGTLRAVKAVEAADAHIISVGTPVDGAHRPDLRHVERAAQSIGKVLRRDDLVVLESTVPPGMTGGRIRQILENASGLLAGRDFQLAHCAERAIPGATLREMVDNDRLVGGVDPASAKRAASLYTSMVRGRIQEVDVLTSEIVKLAENTYRDVNIALANEIARMCEEIGANAWTVIEHANRHPRVQLHRPGPGVGGHCIPVVPWFLAASAPEHSVLIRAARSINDSQAGHVVTRLLRDLPLPQGNITRKVAVLGVAYKAGIDDARDSPAIPIIRKLEDVGILVHASDPHVRRFNWPLFDLEDALRGADATIVLNEERLYASLDPAQVAGWMRGRLILDTRCVLDYQAWQRAGFRIWTLGRGGP